ncbi:beta-lactamase regulating signal transducer with metallopeptidase domain [Neolewinella xylanilytica]|uniref:Beta-lactamase regulating signal transducer with metallopeptidase domain n=1 Tax=Neolewinella xylanilytica TaxID=1514080 RepID=A0A2S6I9K3_9BACT|nr:M56 family metallopeptidase [Neolewinella xylanilytica]PPK88152.1 beta-lactamase regulating signal transducer with metallopeptidase domain [Neolewinella xylanilytica]
MIDLLYHPLLAAVGYALLHSLWVFGLFLLAGRLTAKGFTDPARRHSVLLAFLTLLLPVFGMLIYLGWPAEAEPLPGAGGDASGVPTDTPTDGVDLMGTGQWIPEWLPLLSVMYLIGLLLAGTRTLWAYRSMLGLRKGSILPEAERIADYRSLRTAMAPGCRAKWRLSAAVNQVLTVGVWRPFILFPLALANELSTEEVHAILRHELAHLRRQDPLWQALQQLVATLFFYHPLVNWLCRELDREREFACDDLAAGVSGRKTYARALLRVAAYSLHPKIPFTVSATDRSSFSHRVHRLFGPQSSGNPRGGYFLAPLLSLPLFVLLTLGTLNGPFTTVMPNTNITGTILDGATDTPLVGATVMVKGTNTGTITDIDGDFSLDWDDSGAVTLLISYVGYVSKEIIFDNIKDRELDIELNKQEKVQFRKASGDESASFSNLPDDIILVVDGRIVDRNEVSLSPSTIAELKVIKNKEEMTKLGFDAEKDGVIMVTTKKE